MGIEDIFASAWNLITSSLLCMFLTLAAVILLLLVIFLWRIHRIRSEDAWLHQPFGGGKRRKY